MAGRYRGVPNAAPYGTRKRRTLDRLAEEMRASNRRLTRIRQAAMQKPRPPRSRPAPTPKPRSPGIPFPKTTTPLLQAIAACDRAIVERRNV